MEHINHTTKKQYTGDSPKLLTISRQENSFPSYEWMTAYQGKQAGYQVKPDMKGTRLYRIVELKETESRHQQALIQYYWVYNIEQFIKADTANQS